MKATEILMKEHRLIERMIAVLETAAARLEAGQEVRVELFLEAVDFIKNFADGVHHMKEEGVLFKTMNQHGMPVEEGPIAVMLSEHEQGRGFTRALNEAANHMVEGDGSGIAEVISSARGYAALLRQHIGKEDNILFPMADRIIPISNHEQVLMDFETIEHEQVGEGVHDKYLALVIALEKETSQ